MEPMDLNDSEQPAGANAGPASAPETPVSRAGSPNPRPALRRKQLRLVALLAAIMLVSAGCASALWYSVTKRPLTMLPGVSLVTKAVPPHYVFSITGLSTPEAVAISPDGQRLYVAESGGDRVIQVYSTKGEKVGSFSPPGSMVSFRMPMGIAVAPNGRVFVADRLRSAIDMFTPNGGYIGAYRPEAMEEEPWRPLGVSVDSQDRLIVTDHREGKHRVLVFRSNEYLDVSFGEQGEQQGQFSFPYSAVVDTRGRFYVSDSNNARIQVFDDAGKFVNLTTTGDPKSGLGLPRGMAIDNQNRLYLVDGGAHSIVVYDIADQMKFLFNFGALGTQGGEFRYPAGVAVDQEGRIFIADRDNNSIQVWSY